MNVIFLDIDGVIQSPRYCVAINETGWLSAFEPAAMHMSRNLIRDAKAKIVISSSWRIGHKESRELKQIFRCCGFKEISNAFHSDWRTKELPRPSCRGDEIAEWLSRNPEIENYLILDDDADMLESQKENFVQTCSQNGILLSHYDKARNILGLKDD